MRWIITSAYLACIHASISASEPVTFTHHIMAVLSRSGCNAGACHGNLNGKGGFKLSLRGENPAGDYRTLTRDMLARRTDPSNPAESLLLKKATGLVPHEGGIRFSTVSPEYSLLFDWIARGCPADSESLPTPTALSVTPPSAIVLPPGDRVPLKVTARFSDNSSRDVTGLIATELNNVGVARVLPTGEIVREQDGEVVVLVRYLNLQVPVRIAFLPQRPAFDPSTVSANNEIDRLVYAQLAKLRLTPSPLASDEVFLRRAFLDTCGITPSAGEVRAFLTDKSPDKRAMLIDTLLARPEFASYWAQKWSDLLRNEEKSLDKKGVQVYFRWIRNWLDEDKPLTEFAREILSARGSTYANPAANFYRAIRDPYQRAESVAQVFLGLRVGCAKCHNHPFDRWTQDDYHRFVALFARIDYRVLSNERKDDLDKHEFNGEQIVIAKHSGELPHPRGEYAVPKFLGAETPDLSNADRLGAFADWATAPGNPFFAKAQANRIWFHLFGKGLVDPNDDFRASNPPTNSALLEHLEAVFRDGGFRVKPLVRHILNSRVYQLSSTTNGSNVTDETHFSRALIQPLEAEQLLDAVVKVLGKPVRFSGYPTGTRAGEIAALPQVVRRGAGDSSSARFLRTFGKPDRLLTCECERTEDGGMMQAFQLLTGELLNTLLRDPDNKLGELLAGNRSDSSIIEELYLSALGRFPTEAESTKLVEYLAKASNRRSALEDIAWGLVNAKEFLLRR